MERDVSVAARLPALAEQPADESGDTPLVGGPLADGLARLPARAKGRERG